MFDNVLWSGKVAKEEMRLNDEKTKALYETT
jgi:predicted O-methyltransferase YrrM